jgi:PAS domain S-box-containing protein/putative nucleotidyltransferase with HDIG domain
MKKANENHPEITNTEIISSKNRIIALKISAIYLVISGTWIIFSDKLVSMFSDSSETLTMMQTGKGWFFVIVTALLLYALIYRANKTLVKYQTKTEEHDRKYKTLFESAQDGIFLIKDTRIVDCNTQGPKIFGGSREQVIGKSFLDFSPLQQPDGNKSEKKIKTVFHALYDGKPQSFEWQYQRLDGSLIYTSININPINIDGEVYFQGVTRNITEAKENAERIKNTLTQTIQAIAMTFEKRDPYTAGHQTRVADIAVKIAEQMGLSSDRIKGLKLGGTIHDIGKIYVPSEILNRPGRLTNCEFDLIKSHTEVGYDIIKDVNSPWPLADMVAQHHERLDGSGYPKGLTEDDIILEAKILAVADVVEAMATHRPYRAGLGIEKALDEINMHKGLLYDAKVVDICTNLARQQHILL